MYLSALTVQLENTMSSWTYKLLTWRGSKCPEGLSVFVQLYICWLTKVTCGLLQTFADVKYIQLYPAWLSLYGCRSFSVSGKWTNILSPADVLPDSSFISLSPPSPYFLGTFFPIFFYGLSLWSLMSLFVPALVSYIYWTTTVCNLSVRLLYAK